ncbi:MAG TPA: hypothetical protein VF074_08785 [Pyrinomonadaceae bacterium]
MEIVTGIFKSRAEAEDVVRELRSLNIPEKEIGFLTPEMSDEELEARAQITDTEKPGLGKAMGAAVGGAMGAAGGATLGIAAATLAVPGIGPIIAAGVIGAALLGAAGAATGAVAGDAVEEALGEGLPHENLFIYEEALRRGNSVVIAFVDDDDIANHAREIIRRRGSLDVDQIHESWWESRRDEERAHYETTGGDFGRGEERYRQGFQAALHPKRRSKSYAEVEPELKQHYDESELDSAFRQGYERGLRYQVSVVEIHKV